jgi:dihydroorotate dehydrogenase/Pyruvate/2-oxoacid:ferredoxin oxidoreductase delta subunit
MSIDLNGLKLKNPIMIGAGPWARDGMSIQKCIDAGASAVTTETISLEAHKALCPHMYSQEDNVLNIKMFSDLHLERWEKEIESIDRKDCKIIISIWGSSASEVSYLASKAERMGADAIELSLASPIGARNRMIVDKSSIVSEFAQAAVRAVSIPVFVKLSYEAGNTTALTDSIYEAGVKVVSAIDGLRGMMDIDVENQTAKMPTYGGYTGANIRPISLATTASLKQNTAFQICSVGGITNYEHVLGYIMLGAQATQLASVIQLEGYPAIERILNDLDDWMSSHCHNDYSEIRGVALSTLSAFEDIGPQPFKAILSETCLEDCNICEQCCLYFAIGRNNKNELTISEQLCTGCGLCAGRCPQNKIEIGWSQKI